MVTKCNYSILNAGSVGLCTSISVEGVDSLGAKRSFQISIEDFTNNAYAEFDKMYWSNNLSDPSPTVSEESVTSILDETAFVKIFNTDSVKLGALITFRKVDQEPISGVVSTVATTGDSITVSTKVNNRLASVSLSLIDATMEGFEGEIIVPAYE